MPHLPALWIGTTPGVESSPRACETRARKRFVCDGVGSTMRKGIYFNGGGSYTRLTSAPPTNAYDPALPYP